MIEVVFVHRLHLVRFYVFSYRVAGISGLAEKYHIPEVVHNREVVAPVRSYDGHEYISERIVGLDLVIKGVYKSNDVVFVFNVFHVVACCLKVSGMYGIRRVGLSILNEQGIGSTSES